MLVGALADKDSAMPGETLEAAGQIHFAAEHGVISLLGLRTHQTRCGNSSIDAAAKQKQREDRLGLKASRDACPVLQLTSFVFGGALLVQIVDGALGFDGCANTSDSVLRIGRGGAPKCHDTIADEFVERAVLFDDDIGDNAKIGIDGAEDLSRLFIEAGDGRLAPQTVFTDE